MPGPFYSSSFFLFLFSPFFPVFPSLPPVIVSFYSSFPQEPSQLCMGGGFPGASSSDAHVHSQQSSSVSQAAGPAHGPLRPRLRLSPTTAGRHRAHTCCVLWRFTRKNVAGHARYQARNEHGTKGEAERRGRGVEKWSERRENPKSFFFKKVYPTSSFGTVELAVTAASRLCCDGTHT